MQSSISEGQHETAGWAGSTWLLRSAPSPAHHHRPRRAAARPKRQGGLAEPRRLRRHPPAPP